MKNLQVTSKIDIDLTKQDIYLVAKSQKMLEFEDELTSILDKRTKLQAKNDNARTKLIESITKTGIEKRGRHDLLKETTDKLIEAGFMIKKEIEHPTFFRGSHSVEVGVGYSLDRLEAAKNPRRVRKDKVFRALVTKICEEGSSDPAKGRISYALMIENSHVRTYNFSVFYQLGLNKTQKKYVDQINELAVLIEENHLEESLLQRDLLTLENDIHSEAAFIKQVVGGNDELKKLVAAVTK